MKAWFLSLFAGQAPAEPTRLSEGVTPSVPAQGRPVPALHHPRSMLDAAFFAWMVQCEPAEGTAPGAAEQRVLQRLAARVADPASHTGLLPRTAGVVPALLARLRSDRSSLGELADHVSRDPTLVAEVMAMANSAFYRRERPVMELGHSIHMLGVGGLRAAIARVVLKPMLDARGGALTQRAAPRLWKHTEFKTQLGAEIARSQGLDPFDAYLLALLHDMAWSVVLRELDAAAVPTRPSSTFVAELGAWRDRLAGLIAQQWQPHGAWTRAAVELAHHGLLPTSSAPVLNLCVADQLAWLLCDPDRTRARALAEPSLQDVPPAVRACFDELDGITPGGQG